MTKVEKIETIKSRRIEISKDFLANEGDFKDHKKLTHMTNTGGPKNNHRKMAVFAKV